jgi:hypothetical protein
MSLIGQSRYVGEPVAAVFARGASLRGYPHIRLRYFCWPCHQDSALPVIVQLERAAPFLFDRVKKLGRRRVCAREGTSSASMWTGTRVPRNTGFPLMILPFNR